VRASTEATIIHIYHVTAVLGKFVIIHISNQMTKIIMNKITFSFLTYDNNKIPRMYVVILKTS